MKQHENHQFIEMKSSKGEGNMTQKDVMCPMCGEMRKMHEDGRIEVMKKGDMESMDKNKDMKDMEDMKK